jgi:hypothetical protein
VADSSRPLTAAQDREALPSWDLIPDESAPSRAIVMRFATYEAAHTALTEAGYSPTSSSAHTLRLHDGRTAVKYAHPDGSIVVLAHPLVDPHGGAYRP